MNETALRLLQTLGNEDANRMIKAAEIEMIKPIIKELEDVLTNYCDTDTIEYIVGDFKTRLLMLIHKI